MGLLDCLYPEAPATEALGRVLPAKEIPTDLASLNSSVAVGLLQKKNPAMAVRLIAGWLSSREALWWGALCQAQLVKVKAQVGRPELLNQVVNWIRDPGDSNREAVGLPGDNSDSSPIGLLAQAVVFTTDNLSPLKDHPVACPPGMTHRMVAVAVLGAAVCWPGKKQADCLNHFIALGLDVADGLHLWKEGALPGHPGLRAGSFSSFGRPIGNIWEDWK